MDNDPRSASSSAPLPAALRWWPSPVSTATAAELALLRPGARHHGSGVRSHSRHAAGRPWLLLLALLLTLAGGHTAAVANEVWRLAGTFNNWNTRDDAWRMTALPDGAWFIRGSLPPGEHQFKFVRNGDWSNGHLGARGNSSTDLEQPGGNIRVDLRTGEPFEVVLRPAANRWERGVPTVTTPVAIAAVHGLPRVGLPVRIDLSGSLLPAGTGPIHLAEIEAEAPNDIRRLRHGAWQPEPGEADDRAPNIEDLNPSIVHLVPQRAGTINLFARVNAGGVWSAPQQITLEVRNRVYVDGPHRSVDGMIANRLELHPTNDGRWVAVYTAPRAGTVALTLHDLDQGRTLPIEVSALEAGETFALIYRGAPAKVSLTPGRYRLIEGPGAYALAEDPMPLPASGVLHDPRRPDHATAISAGLGLLDLTAETASPTDLQLSVRIFETNRVRDPQPVVRATVPMTPRPHPEAADRIRWSARIMTDDGEGEGEGARTAPIVHYEIVSETPEGLLRRVAGPFIHRVQPVFETPDWAKRAVWYQIFPERFRNGNPLNDPHGDFVFPLPWNASWHAMHEGEFEGWRQRVIAAGANPDRWDRERTGEPGGRFYNVVFDRRYGGDLQGVMESLDDLQELGVTAIYLNPVFEAESLHKYDTSDFRHIDDNFGDAGQPPAGWQSPDPAELANPAGWTWTEADRYFLSLIEEVHRRGMKIIIDGVFNHVGQAHPAFADVMRHGRDSAYADWFMCTFDASGRLTGWVAWDQPNGSLPKFNQKANRDLVEPVKQHIFDITRRWMDPNGDGDPSDGIDGWRLDVPLDVGIPFWLDWYQLVKSINPDAFIAAEIWTEWESEPHLRGDRFDAQMHYPVVREMSNWLAMQPGMTSNELISRLEGIYARYTPQTALVQQNLLESHDTDRIVSNLYNAIPGRAFDSGNRPQQGENYRENRPDARAYALSRLAHVLQATYVGAPMIFYGQEIGMFGADDPSCRKPRPWPDLPVQENAEDRADFELEQFYREWMNRRANDPVLQLGSVHHLQSGRDDVFAFVRQLNDRAVLVVINKGNQPYPLARLVRTADLSPVNVGPIDAVAVNVDPADILW